MLLYHGSSTGGIITLRPGLSNHDKPYVYLTDCAVLALLYAYNPIARPGGFFPYYFDKAGLLHYEEYFPDQTRKLYAGHGGWVYTAEADGLSRLEKMSWVYLSEADVPITDATFIPDIYTALIEAEAAGRLILHRYENTSEEQRRVNRRVVQKSLEGHADDDYVRFLQEHMPEIFE